MTRRALILHGYSADNAGDGLLVHETIALVREALGSDTAITLLASRPETFRGLGVETRSTMPSIRGWERATTRTLSKIDDFDIVIAVGGGYLRAGTLVEGLKTALVHGPQLRAAARTAAPTIYLPQSIGPMRLGTRRWMRRTLTRIDSVLLRDDRSVAEVGGSTATRAPDLATAAVARGRRTGVDVHPNPVLSIRAIRGRVGPRIYELADRIAPYDGYVQSTVGGNDDRPAASTLHPSRTLDREDLLGASAESRVVVAVRLHAALMALAAGHYVVHLAYERKGFGAFGDLGLASWVHNVNDFDVNAVVGQVKELLSDATIRSEYDASIEHASDGIAAWRRQIVAQITARGARS